MAKNSKRLSLAEQLDADLKRGLDVPAHPVRDKPGSDTATGTQSHSATPPSAPDPTNPTVNGHTEPSSHVPMDHAPAGHAPADSAAQQPNAPSGHAASGPTAHDPIQPTATGHTAPHAHVSMAAERPERKGQGGQADARPKTEEPYSRIGMTRVSGFYGEQCKYQIQQLQWKYGRTTEEEIVGQALNLLFRSERMPECAFDGKDTRKKPITLSPPQQ